MAKQTNRYQMLVEKVFFDNYQEGADAIPFIRKDLEDAATKLNIKLPKNLGDIVYTMRYRTPLPKTIEATQRDGKEWIIEGAGRAKYAFKLVNINRITPNDDLITIKIPDSTPEIVAQYALSDEQALLAKVRYNRLIDLFLGVTSYSLQNHLRTTVSNVGQIEIDEIYVGVDHNGIQYVVPVQAKGGNDQLGVVQTKQDILCCAEKYPELICRAISTQFMSDELIAIFELTVQDEEIRLVNEKHYKLVPRDQISESDIRQYRSLSRPSL